MIKKLKEAGLGYSVDEQDTTEKFGKLYFAVHHDIDISTECTEEPSQNISKKSCPLHT